MKDKKEPSDLSKIIQKNYPGLHFRTSDVIMAGKKLKNGGEQDVISYLENKGSVDPLPDFKPPAKTLIIETSRPISEWSIFKANQSIQQFVFNLSKNDAYVFNASKNKDELNSPKTAKTDIENWINSSKIDLHGYWSVQGLNIMIANAFNIYDGVIKKVENKRIKAIKKIYGSDNKLPVPFIAESSFDINNKLIHSPGINNSIYCYQQISILPIQQNKSFISDFLDRCGIPNGSPGYVPEWQRINLTKKNSFRHRKWYSRQNLKPKANRLSNKYTAEMINQAKGKEVLPCKIVIGDDWFTFDARGLLRNLQWRKLVSRKDCTIEDILKYFTGDPVIDPNKNMISFCYKEGIVPVISKKIITYKKAPDLIKKLSLNKDICLISIDLGQNSFVSAKFSLVKNNNGELLSECLARHYISDDKCSDTAFYDKLTNCGKIKACETYREKSDTLQNKMYDEACKSLPAEMQEEILKINNENSPELILERIKNKLNINTSILPLDKMSNNSHYIADSFKNTDAGKLNSKEVSRSYKKKGSDKEYTIDKSDYSLYQEHKLRLPKEVNDNLLKLKWELQINSDEYKRLSVLKKEWARQVCNWIRNKGKEISGCNTVVINIENLNVDNRVFSGSGKKENGWNNFSKHKKENRWFIQVLHRAFSDLAKDKGLNVIESHPAYTSTTCTKCGNCNKSNRNGVKFRCSNCSYEADADLNIATDNLEKVALTGKAMSKDQKLTCERSGDAETTDTARNTEIFNENADLEVA